MDTMVTMARGLRMPSPDMGMADMDMGAMDMEDMVIMDTMARGLLMLNLDMGMDMAVDMVDMDMATMDMVMDTMARNFSNLGNQEFKRHKYYFYCNNYGKRCECI